MWIYTCMQTCRVLNFCGWALKISMMYRATPVELFSQFFWGGGFFVVAYILEVTSSEVGTRIENSGIWKIAPSRGGSRHQARIKLTVGKTPSSYNLIWIDSRGKINAAARECMRNVSTIAWDPSWPVQLGPFGVSKHTSEVKGHHHSSIAPSTSAFSSGS